MTTENKISEIVRTDMPIIVSYGMGVDSTALLVALRNSNIIPDAILFADVGNEHPETNMYKPVIDRWLADNGFPAITVVRYIPKKFKHGRYSTLYGNCVRNKTLPGISFGPKSCSMKWKGQPLDKWVLKNYPKTITQRLIGYDASTKDQARCGGVVETKSENFTWLYPLAFMGWDRDRCIQEISEAGLMVPHKSACWFCAGTSKDELSKLAAEYPRLAALAIKMEDIARPNLRIIEGLWGRSVKGTRKPESKRPGSWKEFISNPGAYNFVQINPKNL